MIAPLYDSRGKPVSFSYDGANAASRHHEWKPISNPALSEEEVLPIHKRQTLIGNLNDFVDNILINVLRYKPSPDSLNFMWPRNTAR